MGNGTLEQDITAIGQIRLCLHNNTHGDISTRCLKKDSILGRLWGEQLEVKPVFITYDLNHLGRHLRKSPSSRLWSYIEAVEMPDHTLCRNVNGIPKCSHGSDKMLPLFQQLISSLSEGITELS